MGEVVKLLRILAARALLSLVRAADGALELLAPNAIRSLLARLAARAARRLLDFAEWLEPWIRRDYVPPAPEDRRPSWREKALALSRMTLCRWRRALERAAS